MIRKIRADEVLKIAHRSTTITEGRPIVMIDESVVVAFLVSGFYTHYEKARDKKCIDINIDR